MWDVWHAKEEDRLYTFTVLTTFPNEVSGTVHDRMPVIVQPKDHQRWLDPENEDVVATPPSEGWIAYPVNRRNKRNKNNLMVKFPRGACSLDCTAIPASRRFTPRSNVMTDEHIRTVQPTRLERPFDREQTTDDPLARCVSVGCAHSGRSAAVIGLP
jgi:hypothetical protein